MSATARRGCPRRARSRAGAARARSTNSWTAALPVSVRHVGCPGRDGQRVDGALDLAAGGQRLPAGGQQPHARDRTRAGARRARRRRRRGARSCRGRASDGAVAQVAEQLVLRASPWRTSRISSAASTACGHLVRLRDAGEPHERRRRRGSRPRRPGRPPARGWSCPTPPGPVTVTSRVVSQQLADAAQVLVAAEERREPRRQPTRRLPVAAPAAGSSTRCGRPRGRVAAAGSPPAAPAAPRSGLRPEFGVEHVPGALVGRQRVGLPPGPVERQHQAAVQPLAQRMRGGEGLELVQHLGVPPGGQLQVDQLLAGRQLQLGQPGGLRLGPPCVSANSASGAPRHSANASR